MIALKEFFLTNSYYFMSSLGALLIGYLYFWLAYRGVKQRLEKLRAAQQTVIAGIRDHLRKREGADAEEVLTEYESAVERGQEFYGNNRDLMLATARRSYKLTALYLGGFLLCVFFAWFAATQDEETGRFLPWRIFALSSFLPALGLIYWGAVEQGEWGHVKTDTTMTSVVWLMFAFPTALLAGRLDIIAGTLNPDGYSERWPFLGLAWLSQPKQGVRVRMLAAEPDLKGLPEEQAEWARGEWRKIVDRIVQTKPGERVKQTAEGGESRFLLMERRTDQEFCVTAGLVRIEDEHSEWAKRIPEGENTILSLAVVNDLYLV